MSDALNQEQRILIMMRKTLGKVIRETTPTSPGVRRGISDELVDDIKVCLALISAREREMADAEGKPMERPRYVDEPRNSDVIDISQLRSKPGKPGDHS